MNKYIKTIAISAVLMSFIAVAPVLANAQVNGGDDVVSTPATPASGTVASPTVNGSDDGAAATNTGASGSVTTPILNGSDDSNQSASNPSNPGNPGNPGGGPSGGVTINTPGGGSGFVGGSSIIPVPATSTITFVAGGACDYLTSYLKIGGNNSVTEVNKLQVFLKTVEKIDVDVTGIFDNKTFEGVKAFQGKYLADVMGPWGVTTPTGQVWYTTKKKVNEIYCNSIVNLTPQQLAEIEAYRNGRTALTATGTTTNPDGTISTSTQEVGSNSTDNAPLTAASANVPFTTKIWNFVKWLFGY